VLLVRKKLKANHPIESEVPVAWTGGVVGNMRLVREGFFAGLKAGAPAMPVFDKETISIDGAIWRAERLAQSVNEGATKAVGADWAGGMAPEGAV
jgi:hypothetical protein